MVEYRAVPPRHPDAGLHLGDGQTVHAGSVRAGITCDPIKRHQQRRRVVHEVEQIIEPAAGIGRRPMVKLGLASPIPTTTAHTGRPDRERRYSPAHLPALQCPSLLDTAAALPHVPGFPQPEVLRRLRPVLDRSVRPADAPDRIPGARRDQDGSRVHCDSLDEGGARLGPCGLTTATPQHFTVVSRPVVEASPGVPTRNETGWDAPLSAHIRQIRADPAFRDVNAGSLRTPFHPARRTRTIWQCWHVPTLSGPLTTFTATTWIGLPPAPPSCDRIGSEGLSPPLESTAPHGALNGS